MSEGTFFRVSQVNRYLKKILLQDQTLQDIRVLGEISNFKHHRPSGHMYFTLKEGDQILRAVYFQSKNQQLTFLPAEGMSVIARGSTSLYERSGYFQLYVEELEPEGQGALFKAFEKLKEDLQKQGLFDAASKKPLPYLPRKIGVITSPTGAALRDFITTLRRRFPSCQVTVCPVAVQGKDSPAQIVEALKRMDEQQDYDILVLTRGGGSLEELWSFNDEDVARAIFETRTPVVSAVGHETDFTIADFVADCRASTPTAAAELITPDQKELARQLQYLETRLQGLVKNSLSRRMQLLRQLSGSRSQRYVQDKINYQLQSIDQLWQRSRRLIAHNLQLKRSLMKNYADRLQALNPEKIMERGFTLTLDARGKAVKSIANLRENQALTIVFFDGEAGCQVQEIHKKQEQ